MTILDMILLYVGITLIFISCFMLAWVIVGAARARRLVAEKQKELDEWANYWKQLNNHDGGC